MRKKRNKQVTAMLIILPSSQVRVKPKNEPVGHLARDLFQLDRPSPIDSLAFPVSYSVPSTHQEIYISLNSAIILCGELLKLIGQRGIKTSDKLY
jgi:hypothetical protein